MLTDLEVILTWIQQYIGNKLVVTDSATSKLCC